MARRSDDPKQGVYLVVHGHFYQPPRENPWLEAIEREPGAAPYPNWNARISDECYRRNGWARIFDDHGGLEGIVNNYEHLSFNFGPTLLTWLEAEMPGTYARMLEADQISVRRRGGHGNALAQAYCHAILPLCNRRDRLTLIRWGQRDFAHRFGRQAEAMWLPETGIDAATVEDLISEGLKFVVLSPYQAWRVRRLQTKQWTEVRGGKVDPRMPYRIFSAADPERYIDAFFYDGPVSHSISFEKVLASSRQLVDKLWGAVDSTRGDAQLVHAAVDGETFGHHQRHAERALAYAFTDEAPARGFTLTNYGQYLELHPPTHEVQLEPGPDGEGTAWSCAHGVGRWYRDCGCHAGAPAGWDQAWRTPLRDAVDHVRDQAASLFEELGGELLADPWAARDDYVSLLLDGSPDARARFLAQHDRNGRGGSRHVRIFKLLEAQRHSLLAQTSCGWFFNDVGGLEATQNLKYLARTVQLMEDLTGRNVEPPLLELLAEARSNEPGAGNGAEIYLKRALPTAVGPQRFSAQYAITDMFHHHPDELTRYGYQIHRVESHRFASGPLTLSVGRVEVEHSRTTETADLTYVLIHFGGLDFHCAVRSFAGNQQFRAFTRRLEEIFDSATITELLRAVDAHFGETYYDLPQLLPEEREQVLDALFGDMTERFAEMYTRLYMDNRRTVSSLVDSGLKVPREFRIAAEYTLSRQLNEQVRDQRRSRDPDRYQRAREIVREAAQGGYQLDLSESEELFGEMLVDAIRALAWTPTEQACRDALDLIALAGSLQISLPRDHPQEMLYELLQREDSSSSCAGFAEQMADLVRQLRLSPLLLQRAAGSGEAAAAAGSGNRHNDDSENDESEAKPSPTAEGG